MARSIAGWATIVMLLAAAWFTPLPTQPVAALLMGIGALWLEAGGFYLDREKRHRFSPAIPVYLALVMSPGLGAGLAGLFLVADAAHRMDQGFFRNLSQRLPLALALLIGSGLAAWSSASPALLYLLPPVVYLATHWSLRGYRSQSAPENSVVDRQVALRIRPLELAMAAVSPLLCAAAGLHPALFLAILPLLACTHLAAENVLLSASDETIAGVLEKLRGAEAQAARVTKQRDQALQEKRLLEGFSQHLASHPDLQAAASNLVATVQTLVPADSVVVFLGTPPEPFSYRVSPAHQVALQGVALTALREPLVDRAFEQKKPVLQKKPPQGQERLLPADQVAAALPLGSAGVLYVGRQSPEGFTPPQLERLKWLAGKATLALESAFQVNEEALRRRRQEQTVHRLERQVAWLSQLVEGAEGMASSLEAEVLVQRLTSSVSQAATHLGGQLLLEGRAPVAWGEELVPHPDLLHTARETGRPLIIEDTSTSRFGSPGQGVFSLLFSPLLARQQCIGMLVLGSHQKAGFSSEQVDLLFLLCSQAAMALSHSTLYTQVVEARQQLEQSQAGLVQSSKLMAVGQLAAGVAHELNSPLGAISLSVGESLNQLDDRPELARKLLTKAQQAVIRAKAIVERLMAYSRKPQNQLQKISLQAVVRDTVEFLTFQLRSAEVAVDIESDDLTMVVGEEQPLQQVITNLILNAAQSMEETALERRRISISLIQERERIRMEVSDNGSGISEENLQRIFDPFFTTRPVGRGTGLGLWACQQIVDSHNGTISVCSVVGEGSRFTVLLPIDGLTESDQAPALNPGS